MPGISPTIVPQSGGGLKALGKRISKLVDGVDPRDPRFRQAAQPVLNLLDKINEQDRLRGVDRHGNSLPPLKYRPEIDSPKTKKGNRQPKFGDAHRFGNLSTKEYKKLTGPRLAPRKRASRIISNYVTGMEFLRGKWVVRAGWRDILDKNGKSFLQYHLNGSGKLPKCDIGGISKRALKQLSRVAIESFREVFK